MKKYTTKEDVEKWLARQQIIHYRIHEDLRVDVQQDVVLNHCIGLPVQFDVVEGNFRFQDSLLKSLSGAPVEVKGKFDCSSSHLSSLKHGPRIVLGEYNCSFNQLKDLNGVAKNLTYLNMGYNQITSLKEVPRTVKTLRCAGNLLSSFLDIPSIVTEVFAEKNKIQSFHGLPSEMDWLDVSRNPIHTFEGCPQTINYDLSIKYCPIKSFHGMPKKMDSFDLTGCEILSLEGFESECSEILHNYSKVRAPLPGLEHFYDEKREAIFHSRVIHSLLHYYRLNHSLVDKPTTCEQTHRRKI